MGDKLKSFFIGRPLRNEAIVHEKLGVLWGLPILASDAVSSVAYASEQILLVLLPVFYGAAYGIAQGVLGVIFGLLALLVLSYRQTIDAYPNGGGAYNVAKDNLGAIPGITAGAALAVDYVLTVAVSVASGVEQISTAFPALEPYVIPLCVAIIALLMLGNLRGTREASRIFGVPTYLFVGGMALMFAVGAYKLLTGTAAVNPLPAPPAGAATTAGLAGPAALVLILRAFSNGCAAITGVEAVSNAVPFFKKPSTQNAKRVLLLLALCVFGTLAGTSLLAVNYHVVAGGGHPQAVIVQLAQITFGHGTFFYFYIVASTFILLVLAANTAYSGFPLLLSLIATDGYAPRQMNRRGDRLSYSNGILALSAAAALLIVVFRARVNALIGLYAIGVFISFTLSQFGMFRRWLRVKGRHWHWKAGVNGLGACITALAVLIIAVFKFEEGAWIVIMLVPTLVYGMLKIKRHYTAVARQLRVSDPKAAREDLKHHRYRTRIIVPLEGINRASIRALRYARTISDNVTAFSVAIDSATVDKLRDRWNKMNTDIPYIIRLSPSRRVPRPLLEFIESEEYDYRKDDIITVILPQLSVRRWWHHLLHNHTRRAIERRLLLHKHIVVAVMPFQLKDDHVVTSDSDVFE